VEGVLEVHDLHVWSLSVGKPSLSVHLLVTREDAGSVLKEATALLGRRYNIHHSTIQVEREGDDISCNEHWK
jgi:Co/Zn/Cd efflux system component